MLFSACAVTECGPLYIKNQDCFAMTGQENIGCVSHAAIHLHGKVYQYAVCDGIGSMPGSEKAAEIACKILINPLPISDLRKQLWKGMLQAEERVCQLGRGGTTAVALYSDGEYAAIANVGDSRAYLFRGGHLSQLSVDHNRKNILQTLQIDEATAKSAGLNPSALTQYLGMGRERIQIEPSCSPLIRLEEQDCFLLCTDGLTSVLPETEITAVLGDGMALRQKAEQLMKQAIQEGAQDNVTVLLCKCDVK